MEILIYTATYIQLVTFIFSLLFLCKYQHTPLKILPFFYGLVASVEIFCMNFYKVGNVWLYSILLFIQINFFGYLFYQYFEGSSRKFLIGLIILFNLIYFGVYLSGVTDFMKENATYPYVAGIIILIILLVMMFNHMLKIENFNGLTRNLLFWLCFSLLFFHATSLPLFSITRWSDIMGEFKSGFVRILLLSVIFSHLILIFGFIWSKKKYTY